MVRVLSWCVEFRFHLLELTCDVLLIHAVRGFCRTSSVGVTVLEDYFVAFVRLFQ